MKVKLGFGLSDDMAVMHAIQAALGDRAVTLMVDTNHGYGFADALAGAAASNPSSFVGTKNRWLPRITPATANCGRP